MTDFSYIADELAGVLDDPIEFTKRLQIKMPNGTYIPFGSVMTEEQEMIIRTVVDPDVKRIAIVKARQMGITTAVRAACFWATYVSPDSTKCAIAGPIKETADEIIEMDRTYFHELPKPLQRVCKEKAGELSFPTTNSYIRTFSADNRSHLRGYTFLYSHLTEFAFYRKPQDFLASVEAATAFGTIIIESTPNHYNDALHQILLEAEYNPHGWTTIFLPWSSYHRYREEVPDGFEPTEEERMLLEEHSLDMEQIVWRRNKISKYSGDVARFRREYPLTVEEAYSLSEDNYFTAQHFQYTQKIEIPKGKEVIVLDDYDPRDTYVMGVDIAGGVGQDYSVACIVSRMTNSPVAIIASNQLSVHDFCRASANLATQYKCRIVYEENNHGAGYKEVLHHIGYNNNLGFKTTARSKLALYATLREHLESGLIAYLDELTYTEMHSLIKDPKGNAPAHPEGAHDDRVIAYAIALHHIKDLPMPETDWDKTLAKIRNRNRRERTALPGKHQFKPRLKQRRRRR